MAYYCYNTNTDSKGNHEVHTTTCSNRPSAENQVSLGLHSDCQSAISKAKSISGKSNFDGCYYCCRPCHKG